MSRGLKMGIRFLLVVAVITSTAYLCTPASSTGSPYASSLSVLTAAPAFAAGSCSNSICNVLTSPQKCTAKAPGMKCKVTGQGCSATAC